MPNEDANNAKQENLQEISGEHSTILSIKNEPSISNSEISETLRSIKVEDQQQLKERLVEKNESQESLLNKFEDEKAYKSWKKSVSMVLSNITSHK